MEIVPRILAGLALAAVALAGDDTLRGRIRQEPGKPPVIQIAGGKSFTVGGDDFTRGQMADPQLNGREIELEGRLGAPGREIELEGRLGAPGQFDAARIFTIKNGKRYKVTYWCDICSIRTHMPGRCMCCQAETELQELPVP